MYSCINYKHLQSYDHSVRKQHMATYDTHHRVDTVKSAHQFHANFKRRCCSKEHPLLLGMWTYNAKPTSSA